MNERPTNSPGLVWPAAILLAALLLLAAVTCGGCSPTRQIATSLTTIGEAAGKISDDMRQAQDVLDPEHPARPFVEDAAAQAQTIQTEVGKGQRALTGTTDKVSPWLTWLTWGAIAVVLVVVLVLLWKTGILGLVGSWVAMLRVKLSPTTALQGEALAKLEAGTMTTKEYTAAQRSASVTTDKAYETAKVKLAKEQST